MNDNADPQRNMKTIRKVVDILCEFELDENDFVNVFIADGQALLPQWIVRGAVDEEQAITGARNIIELLKTGVGIVHSDTEGRVQIVRDGLEHHRSWHYEQLKYFHGTLLERRKLLRKLGDELTRRLTQDGR